MAFLSPLFLAGALAAGIPILLHLLKRHPEVRVKFSAVRLLRSAPVEHSQQRHLRELLLLALRVTALVLLALAFARPFLASSAADSLAGAIVVAMDTSLSMSAPGQFEKARRLAAQAIDRDGARGLRAVVTFADGARIASALSGDRALARAAIEAAQPGAGATSYRAALLVAADALGGRPGTIVVVTDLQESGWEAGDRASLPASARVEVADVGPPPPGFSVSAARLVGDRVVATVRSSAAEARDAHVRLSAGSGVDVTAGARVIGETTVPVGGGQTTDVTFAAPTGRWASVSVDDADGARADHVRYLILASESRPKVLIVTTTGDATREAFYVEQALVAGGADGRVYEVEGVAGSGLQSWDQTRFDAHTAVVLLSTRGLDHHGRGLVSAYLRAGGGVLVATGPDVDGEVLSETLGGLKVSVVAPPTATQPPTGGRTWAPSDARHPVLQVFAGAASLGTVRFQRVTTLRADDCQTLARFTTGETALVDCEQGAGRALLLASDLDHKWNDFPLHATFLPFVHEAMHYVVGARRSSEYLVGAVPSGVPPVPGVVAIPGLLGSAAQLAAVNVDPVESDPSRLTAEQFLSAVVSREDAAVGLPAAANREREDRQHLWQYALSLMAAVLVFESVVATRAA